MPQPLQKMNSSIASALRRGAAFLTPNASSDSLPKLDNSPFATAPSGQLFPQVDPAIDGQDCFDDCATCTTHLPAKWSIDEDKKLYGDVKGWSTHLLVATGKRDWVRDVEDEKGSVMEAVGKCGIKPSNGRLMLSASNMPLPSPPSDAPPASGSTTVLLLPAFTLIDNVTPASVPDLITHYIDPAPTNTTPLPQSSRSPPPAPPSSTSTPPLPTPFPTRPCPHTYLLLLCSQRTRDARCGQSAPLLRREFERHLRPLGLYRDLQDERPGGVGIYFISHVGGHKFSANVMVYRRGSGEAEEADQCIWLARVRPEDCEGIVRFTVLQGKVVKPERQLRGGFDRGRGVVSW